MASQLAEHDGLSTVTVDRRNDAGEVLASVQLSPEIFGRTPNVALMHQIVTAQLAARRSGTHSTRTRAEVRGGGAKPYRQKGTGRARQGTIRAPQFAGGGVAFGPKPRSYAQHTPKKMTRLALYCALSDRAAEGRVCLVDRWSFDIPKTKDAIGSLRALGLDGSVLVVMGPEDSIAERSFANLPEVDLVEANQLTAYDVLVNDWVVFTDATVPGEVREVAGAPTRRRTTPRKSAAGIAPDAVTEDPAAEVPAAEPSTPAAEDSAGTSAAEDSAGTSAAEDSTPDDENVEEDSE
jgi:large subunit ribosomal protein L4